MLVYFIISNSSKQIIMAQDRLDQGIMSSLFFIYIIYKGKGLQIHFFIPILEPIDRSIADDTTNKT